MNASLSAPTSPTDPVARTERPRVLIWDLPVRVFHWLAVASFFGAWITAESDRWRTVHVTLGYTLAGLVAFRLVWGLVGSRHARFAAFVRGPKAVVAYLRGLLQGQPVAHAGHNPAGAWAIVGLLLLSAGVTASGYAHLNELGGEWLEDLHEALANGLMALVAVHVAGVLVASWLHRDNLVRGMLSGHKAAEPGEGIQRAWRSVGLLLLVAVLGFWAWQAQTAPVPTEGSAISAISPKHDGDQDDDD